MGSNTASHIAEDKQMTISINVGGSGSIKGSFEPTTEASIDANTVVEYQNSNPKRAGKLAYTRFESYKGFKGTVSDLLTNTECKTGDLKYDLEHGFVRIIKAAK